MKRFFKISLIILTLVSILILLFSAEEDYRGARVWAKTKREFEQKGISFDISSVIPPEVPDDQNFAATPCLKTLFDYKLGADGKPLWADSSYLSLIHI